MSKQKHIQAYETGGATKFRNIFQTYILLGPGLLYYVGKRGWRPSKLTQGPGPLEGWNPNFVPVDE